MRCHGENRTEEGETERRRDAQRELPVVREGDLEHLARGDQERERTEDLQLARVVHDIAYGEQGGGDTEGCESPATDQAVARQ